MIPVLALTDYQWMGIGGIVFGLLLIFNCRRVAAAEGVDAGLHSGARERPWSDSIAPIAASTVHGTR